MLVKLGKPSALGAFARNFAAIRKFDKKSQERKKIFEIWK